MEQGMDDRHLDESLRRLPEARAGEGFTATVMTRLDAGDAEPAPAASWWAPLPRLAATAAVLVAAVAFGFWLAFPTATAPDGADAPAAVATIPPAGAEPIATAADREPAATQAANDVAPPSPPAAGDPAPRARRPTPATARPAAMLAYDDASDLDRQAAARRLAELRRERERLVSDLATLAAAERPTVVLGGDETVELVLDFGEAARGGVRPAAYRPNGSD